MQRAKPVLISEAALESKMDQFNGSTVFLRLASWDHRELSCIILQCPKSPNIFTRVPSVILSCSVWKQRFHDSKREQIEGRCPPVKSVKLSRSLLYIGGSLEVQTHQYPAIRISDLFWFTTFSVFPTSWHHLHSLTCGSCGGYLELRRSRNCMPQKLAWSACEPWRTEEHWKHLRKQSSLVVSNNVQLSLKEACSDMFCWRLNSEGILWSWSFSFDHGHEFTARCSRRGWAFQWLWAMVLKQNRDIILCLPLETAFGQCQLNLTSTCETGPQLVQYKYATSKQWWSVDKGGKNSEFMWHSVGNT